LKTILQPIGEYLDPKKCTRNSRSKKRPKNWSLRDQKLQIKFVGRGKRKSKWWLL